MKSTKHSFLVAYVLQSYHPLAARMGSVCILIHNCCYFVFLIQQFLMMRETSGESP